MRLELQRALILKSESLQAYGQIGSVKRGPGLSVGAFQQHAYQHRYCGGLDETLDVGPVRET